MVPGYCRSHDFTRHGSHTQPFLVAASSHGILVGIDTKIEVIVASPTTWEAHHSPRAIQQSNKATTTKKTHQNMHNTFGHWLIASQTHIQAVVSFTGRWWRNNDRNGGINLYSIMMKQNKLQINKRMQGECSKLPQNCLSYSMVTCAQLAIVQWSHVTWLFLPGNTCSNHCDVKTRFVTLNFSHTLHKNNWQNTHYNSW